METITRKFRVGHVTTEEEARNATGVPKMGEVSRLGTVTKIDVINNNNRWFLITVHYTPPQE